MRSAKVFGVIVALWSVVFLSGSAAQPVSVAEAAWKPMLEHEGVAFAYIFYSEADNQNNGVVVRLINQNDFAVDYRFTIIFRASDAEHEEEVSGSLAPGEYRTGDHGGLFWIPFRDGRSIIEVGLRGYRITPHDEQPG